MIESYPWPHPNDTDWPSLLRLRPEDVGYDMQGTATGGAKSAQAPQSDAEGDPLVSRIYVDFHSTFLSAIQHMIIINADRLFSINGLVILE